MTTYFARTASISDDEKYRYRLIRSWTYQPLRIATFVMFNPSTADATTDDATIRRCVGFAQRFGCEALKVVNLFAFRATDPKALLSEPDPVGPANDNYLRLAMAVAVSHKWPLIVAWGTLPERLPVGEERVNWFRAEAKYQKAELQCLGTTRNGSPKHPVRLLQETELQTWQ